MITFDSKSLIFDQKRIFPIMGEMHYSRCDIKNWKRSLERMRCGGVSIVSSYVIWIHHEEEENQYDFSSNKDLRSFVKLIKDMNMLMLLRIGPWIHGEVRNGGFPDWLLHKDFEPRSNDPRYFEVVKKFFAKIYSQVYDLFYPNGPIIGVQIENEYGHCGGLNGEPGEEHMRKLCSLAKEIGYNPQLFTATGWGGAVTGGLLPVMGAYCDAPWDSLIGKLPPNPNYLISFERNDKNIGSDLGLGYGLTFNTSRFPYLMAELGGGLNPTYHRRVIASSQDTGAMTMCKIAGGCNLLGYYMYHGGTNPNGKLSTLEESKISGSINDMPKLNYDGRPPLRQYGQYGEAYKEIRLFTTFVKEFESFLCESETYIPEVNAKHADDFESVRYSIRHYKGAGILFVNNYVRGYQMPKKEVKTVFDGEKEHEVNLVFQDGQYGMYLINYPLSSEAKIISSNVTPLCKLNNQDLVFYKTNDCEPLIQMDGEYKGNIIILSRNEALDSCKVRFDKEYLISSKGQISFTDKQLKINAEKNVSFTTYPKIDKEIKGWKKEEKGIFTKFCKSIRDKKPIIYFTKELDEFDFALYTIDIDYQNTKSTEILMDIYYQGNKAEMFINDQLVNDDFYAKGSWQVELNALGRPKTIIVKVYYLSRSDRIYFEYPLEIRGDKIGQISNIEVKCLYTYEMEII